MPWQDWSVGAAGRMVSRGVRRSAVQRAADTDRWVAARTAGITLDAIAAQAGVGAATISRATSQFGPFPPANARRGLWPEFLTVAQIGDELAIGAHVVYDLMRNGRLPARRVGAGRYQVERQTFERWIADPYQQTRDRIAANPGDFARNLD